MPLDNNIMQSSFESMQEYADSPPLRANWSGTWLLACCAPKDGTIIIVRGNNDSWPLVAAYMPDGPPSGIYPGDKEMRWYLGPGHMARADYVAEWMPFPLDLGKLT